MTHRAVCEECGEAWPCAADEAARIRGLVLTEMRARRYEFVCDGPELYVVPSTRFNEEYRLPIGDPDVREVLREHNVLDEEGNLHWRGYPTRR